MRAVVVKGRSSKLHGAACGLCPKPVAEGQTVLYRHMSNSAYLEDRLVFHADCMAALLERAPAGRPAGDARARATAIRIAVQRTGDLYARPATAA